jgi:starch phosphorylase
MDETFPKDPVCGMEVAAARFVTTYQGRAFQFCSELCQGKFLTDPKKYATAAESVGTALPAVYRVAYFSMEVAIDAEMPSYSGGLGILAGDTLKSSADLKIPMVGVSLLYGKGYFKQVLDESGNQTERPALWAPGEKLRALSARVSLRIEGRPVLLRAWKCEVADVTGWRVPLLLLDSDLPENAPYDREITARLYAGDQKYRLAQEIVLGIGGVRMLRALGYNGIQRFHMNEGHSSLLTLELLAARRQADGQDWDFKGIRESCVFTTHTSVQAGHDQFPYELVNSVLEPLVPLDVLQMMAGQSRLNMTLLGLNMSHYVNGVAKRHGQVSAEMFPGHPIDSITNGVHSVTWTCPSFAALYDRHIPGWRADPSMLRHVMNVPKSEVWQAHLEAKEELLAEVQRRTKAVLRKDVLTVGFARRATSYKRADLVFSDLDRLRRICREAGPIQFLFAGKAHPNDEPGKELIRRVVGFARQLGPEVPVVYLEDYGIRLAQMLTAGVDLWLNTPLRPMEASGTSGMKAAHNGVPSFSVLDGWWIEGHIENVTGWSIGPSPDAHLIGSDTNDSEDLYRKLRQTIVPMFYQDREQWLSMMRQSIAFNASFFNTHRMVQQYAANAYI